MRVFDCRGIMSKLVSRPRRNEVYKEDIKKILDGHVLKNYMVSCFKHASFKFCKQTVLHIDEHAKVIHDEYEKNIYLLVV